MAAALAHAPSQAAVAPRITVEERFYDIKGSDLATLRAQMRSLGPFSSRQNNHVPARMEATINFNFTPRVRRGRCRVTNVRVRASITYHFPRWRGLDTAPPELVEKWRTYFTNLILHEEGHGKLVIEAAHETVAALTNTPSSRRCSTLRKRARSRGAEVLQRMKRAQIQYDIDTRGGATQGAVLRDDPVAFISPEGEGLRAGSGPLP